MKVFPACLGLCLSVSTSVHGETPQGGNPVYNRHSQLSVANINEAAEILHDPTVAADNLKKSLAQIATRAKNKLQAIAPANAANTAEASVESDEISDPTRMTGSFRSTLRQMQVRTTTSLDSTTSTPALPKVSLAAIVYGDADSASAMLHVNDRTVMVKVGDKASFLDNGQLIEVVVQKINRNDIWLVVYPSRQIIVLR